MVLSLKEYLDIERFEKSTFVDFFINVLVSQGYSKDELLNWKVKKIRKEAQPFIEAYRGVNVSKLKKCIQTDIGELHFKPLHTFTFSEFIDLDYFGKKKQVAKICSLVYRECKVSRFDKDVWEEWGGYSHKREGVFLDTDAAKLIGGYKEILNQKKDFLAKFPELFETPFDYDKELEKVDEEGKKVILEEQKKEEVKKAMNFDLMIDHLSGGDITKYDAVLDMNIYKVFRFLKTQKYQNDN